MLLIKILERIMLSVLLVMAGGLLVAMTIVYVPPCMLVSWIINRGD